ncbi:MAG: SET domain-containing protein [Polyangiaceae bacterium]
MLSSTRSSYETLMREPLRPVPLDIRETPNAGRGVFALELIPEGALIEECPVVELREDDVAVIKNTTLGDYYFTWGGTHDEGAIALGYASLFNHSATPNAMYVKKRPTLTIAFFAIRDIAAGEEITVSYHGGFGDRGPAWFQRSG